MKLKPDQKLYVRSMGKALLVTAIFTDSESANVHMGRNTDDAVVAVFGDFVFLANVHDKGVQIMDKPVDAAAQAMYDALRAVLFQATQGPVLYRDACITQARAAYKKAGGTNDD